MRVFENYAQLQTALDKAATESGAYRFLSTFEPAGFRCVDCGKVHPFQIAGVGTGYARTAENEMLCYSCIGVREARDLNERGKGYLYLSNEGGRYRLTNWPGTLIIPLYGSPRKGRHNIAGSRYDVWFSWNGAQWHGVQYGENSQVCHVRRLKAQ